MLLEPDIRPQRRTGITRSKAGCSTCKRRRVKCDETLPQCLRCQKAKLPCEGYSRIPAAKKQDTFGVQAHGTRAILPRTDPTTLSTVRPTSTLAGETDVENRYLQYFHQETTSGFQSAWDWSLWNHLVLQGCHHEPFVRYAVVAIGALHKSLRMGRDGGFEVAGSIAKLHREFAYLTYGKAIKHMQGAIVKYSGPRYALMGCLLIVLFESHNGNRYKAVSHAQYGLRILQQDTEQSQSLQTEKRESSPLPGPPVEEEIVQAFRNLDIQITTINDERTIQSHAKAVAADRTKIENMPKQLENLKEARYYWSFLLHYTFHWFSTTWKRTKPHLLVRPFGTDIPGGHMTTSGQNIHTTSFFVPADLEKEQEQYSADVDKWLTAFQPVFLAVRSNANATPRERVIAAMLRMHGLFAQITVTGVSFLDEILYDQFMPEFEEIVGLAEEVATIRNGKADNEKNDDPWAGSFTLELGIIEPLFRLLMRCRSPTLRRKAIAILRTWHIECWWSNDLIIAIGEFIMEVEEQGMVDGFIPPESRAILTAKNHNPPDRFLLVQCVQKTGGPDGGMKWTEKKISW